ncbi:Glycosyltransferase involved in cell wall bisynthesis [Rhizobiales bacterium GAS113]|nr:Glycosyltransferase involved in cell wall bisynthesis [Rhizobiales bacterium GAS113]
MQTVGTAAADKAHLSITVIILTFNEEVHIERCIASIAPLAERIIIVDSFSTDRTVEIARKMGAEIVQRAFKHQADQFQWAQENCNIATDWVLRLDADEYLETLLISAIRSGATLWQSDVTAVNFRLKVIFREKWIRFGGYYSTILTRMWRTGAGIYEQRWMDEKVVITHGRILELRSGDLVDHNLQDIDWWTAKHNRYATRQMVDFINREYELFPIDESVDTRAHAQARWKRFLRNRVFSRAPLYIRSVLYFIYRYLLRGGFLDGKQGFVWHFLQGFWFFVLTDAKIDEARSFIRRNGRDAFRERLRTHYKIEV